MAAEEFHVTYKGDGLRDGAIDVYALAPALVALGNLVSDANRLLNGDRATVHLQVNSDFKKGSFDIPLLLNLRILETAHRSFEFAGTIDGAGLLHALFGAAKDNSEKLIEAAVVGLLAIYRVLKGEKPKPNSIIIRDNHGTINIGNKQVVVDARAAQMYMNDAIRADIDEVARSVAREGIEKLQVSKDGTILDTIAREDLPPRITAFESTTIPTEHALTNTREALVTVVTANFEQGKWRFSDGASKFSATLADPIFQQKLDARLEGFYKGDILRVRIKTEQTEKANGKIITVHTIEEVLDHQEPPSQRRLSATNP
jgi:hypothetical protein